MNDLKNETNIAVKLSRIEWIVFISILLTPFVCAFINSQNIVASLVFGGLFWGGIIVLGKFFGFIR